MTEIFYERDRLRMDIRGHAGAGKYGQDTVCAAVSILAMTLEKTLEENAEIFLPAVEKQPGRMMVFSGADEELGERCREIFDTVFTGFALLAENYPQFVQVYRSGVSDEDGGVQE